MNEFNKNYRIPARIVDFEATTNKYLSKAKLEVFYIGETVDKRLFTQSFSESLLGTIPQMPVVGYFDEDEEDFIGHNKEQYVYGYVPETTKLEFTERDGKTFAVTDVILFTGRDDNIGDVAKKIVGKSQSLEMDPASVTYKVNKENGKFKNIEFTSGHITGMSVLGDDENPAFSGSHFFKENLEQHPEYAATFVKFIKEAKELFGDTGGVSMDKFLEQLKLNFDVEAFIKKTYDEERAEVHTALAESRGNQWFHIVQMNSDTTVVYDYETGEFSRMNYSRNEEEGIEFGDSEKVIARYLTEDEIDSTFSTEDVEDETETEETDFTAQTEDDTETETEEEEVETTFTETETEEEEVETEEEEIVETEFTESNEEEELEVEQTEEEVQEEETNFTESDDSSSSETLISQEREELERFRRKEKLDILAKYTEYLTEDEVKVLSEGVADYSAKEFEKEIKVTAFEAMQIALTENKNKNTQEEPVTTFTMGDIASNNLSKQELLDAAMKNLL